MSVVPTNKPVKSTVLKNLFILIVLMIRCSKTNFYKFNFSIKSRSNKSKMQGKKAGEHELVKMWMTALCKNAGFTDCVNLVQRDLKFLCDRIETETGVLISLSTIKRLLNGQFSRVPQIATLDAIARTAGYQNWQSFKQVKNRGIENNPAIEDRPGQTKEPGNDREKNPTLSKLLIWAGLLLLLILGLLTIRNVENPGLGNAGKAKFSVIKTTGNDVPNTVIFRYNIDSVQADSFFIQQSWDRNRRVRIFKHSYTLTDIYYEPGYHTAKLIANDKIIKTV